MSNTRNALDRETIKQFAKDTNAKVMLFLGAGASKGLGLPIMNEFFEAAYPGIHEKIWGTVHSDELETTLLRAVFYGKSSKSLDLEEVVTFLDNLRLLRKRTPKEELSRLILLSWLFGSHTPQDEGSFNRWYAENLKKCDIFLGRLDALISDYRQKMHDVFGNISPEKAASVFVPLVTMTLARSKCVPLFTTNYDTGIESARSVKSQEMSLTDGFVADGNLGVRVWRMQNYLDANEGTLLFKLHGSTNWYEKNGIIRYRAYDDFRFPSSGEAVIQLPVLRKGKAEEPYSQEMYAALEGFLRTVQVCVCVGFSFRDDEIRSHFETTLRVNAIPS